MNRSLLVLCVTAALVLAGCSGWAPGDAAETPTETTGPTDTPSADGTDADDGTDSEDGAGTGGEPAMDDETDAPDPPDGTLEIHHLDVGQADATLLVAPGGETVLVDSGDWRDDGETVLEYLESAGIDRIDHLVATHGHADHVGGHAAVIERLEVEGDGIGAVYDSGVAHTSQTYENYIDAVETHDVTFYAVQEGDELPLETEGFEATVLNPPPGDAGSDLHENAVSLALEYGEFRYLLTGDAESDVESRLVDDRADALEADAYQAGHHGSSTSSSGPFLEAVDPEIAVISSAEDSQYGHPHDEVLEAFADRGIETYWTAVHGTVVLSTDGETYAVEPEREGPTDAMALLEEKPDDESTALTHPSFDGPAAPTIQP